jgi:peptide/nickel transport system ATP-binding protein
MSDVSSAVVSPLLETRDLRVTFERHGRRVTAVESLSYRLAAGRTLAIVGESGAGKTAACRALMGLLPPAAVVAGSARLGGTELIGLGERELRRRRGADVAMVFQDPARSLNPTMRVGEQIAETIRAHRRLDRRAARRHAVELLTLMRLNLPEQQFYAYPHQLSGGMRQRVLIAIALACEPKLLIADEATKSLDVITQTEILELLADLQRRRGMAMILVSHDLRLATAYADEILVLQGGRLVEHGAASDVLERPRSAYTRALLGAVPAQAALAAPVLSPAPTWSHAEAPLLEARGIVQQFAVRGRFVHAVSGVSFDIRVGETLGLVGETGSGKSTLARALLQAPRPTFGSVLFRGQDLTQLRGRALLAQQRHLQMVFQDPFGSLDPRWRVGAIVEEPLLGFGLGDRAARCRKVDELLECVGLPPREYRERRPHELSGGQCQRVAIARALAAEPALIVCDEAVASLDVLTQAQMVALFEQLRAELGLSYLFISHDLALVARIAHRVAVMHLGQLCEIGPTASVYREPFHPYTAALLATVRATRSRAAPLQPPNMRADPPPAILAPSGCRFRGRCPRAEQRCAIEDPRLSEVEQGRFVACHFPVEAERVDRLATREQLDVDDDELIVYSTMGH